MNTSSTPIMGNTNPTSTTATTRPLWAVRIYRGLITFFWLVIVVLTFLAGATIFVGGEWRTAHIAVGHLLASLPLLPITILTFSFLARLPNADKGLAGLLMVLTFLQPVWLYLRGVNILFAAIHPVNALVLFALPLYILMRVRRLQAQAAQQGDF